MKTFDSYVVRALNKKKVVGSFFSPGLHKTYGMYKFYEFGVLPEGVTIDSIYNKCKAILGRDLNESEFVKYSNLPKIIFMEIQYLLYILDDIVESDWPIDREEIYASSNQSERYISKEVKLAVWRRDHGRCSECGSKEKIEFDHIIPVSRGGSNTERNIQLLCEPCNRKKSASIV